MRKLSIVLLVSAFFAMFAAPAFAQDGPTMTGSPIAEAGVNTITLEGSGFSPDLALFVLPCPGADGDIDAFLAADAETRTGMCNLDNLAPVTTDADGAFTIDVEFDIPAEGMLIAAGNSDQTEGAFWVAMPGGDAEAAEEPAEEAEEADLADTGAESGVLVGLGATLLGLGVVATRAGRRLGDR